MFGSNLLAERSNEWALAPIVPRNFAGTPSFSGTPGHAQLWKEAIDMFYWDEVVASYEMLKPLGVAFEGRGLSSFQVIESEALTRETSRYEKIDDHHTLELAAGIESERPHLTNLCLAAIANVSGRLGWDFSKDGWISVLVDEVYIPRSRFREGYMLNKYPYDKICLPASLLTDSEQFSAELRHEYAHLVVLNRTLNRAPMWLKEAVATAVKGGDKTTFRLGSTWNEPALLDAVFRLDERDEAHHAQIEAAYVQARIVGQYLFELQGDEGIRVLLGAFANRGIWTEVKTVMGEPCAEGALRKAYGFGQKELFARAKAG